MHVLIADGDAESRDILQAVVERAGHNCLVAADGARAWEFLRTAQIDVLLGNQSLFEMDGSDLYQQIRQRSRADYTYIMFLAARDEQKDVLPNIQAGADDYLATPLDEDELKLRLIVAARVAALHRQLTGQQTQLDWLNRQLLAQARRDPLTQLGNRLRLHEDLEMLAGRVARYGQSYCAALCDIDNFKEYNEQYGHLAGDEALRSVASTIARNSRSGDMIYRYGGETFLLILPEQSSASASVALDRLRGAIESLGIEQAAQTPTGIITISAGVAALEPNTNKTVQEWLGHAEIALARAKAAGRNCVAVYADVEIGD
jgi:two-component system chemotaxis response regulator CheY